MSVQAAIQAKLLESFAPLHLQVENESHRHNVPAGSETHFKITLVAPEFTGKSLVVRHQSIYALLRQELQSGIHALALHLYTEAEWRAKEGAAPPSPPCLGGSVRRV